MGNQVKAMSIFERTSNSIPMKLLRSFGKPRSPRHTFQQNAVESAEECSGTSSTLYRPLRPLHNFLSVAGIGPYAYNHSEKCYEISWKSLAAIHTVSNCCYLTALMTVTAMCIIQSFVGDEVRYPPDEINVRSMKVIAFVILCGYEVNAWVQTLNAVFSGRRLCQLLNSWDQLGVSAGIDPTKGVYLKSYLQIGFMIFFIVFTMVATFVERPVFISLWLDAAAERMYLIPRSWMSWTIYRKVIHVAVCLISLHQFAINKGSVFNFTTHCHFLKTGITAWNDLLSQVLEDIWEKGEENCLHHLIQSRRKLVQLVRATEQVFSPVLQCYFATTVVIVCTELYILANRMGSGNSQVDELVILSLLTVQTSSLLVHVSFAAGSVQEQAEASADVLTRGLPHSASDVDKFYMGELTRSISMVPVYITGGNFFTINRAFVLTVVSVVASYFIVILQFMQSCKQEDQRVSPTNATFTLSTTLL